MVQTGRKVFHMPYYFNFSGINLQVSHLSSPLDGLGDYIVYGVCATEVELDVLTGTHSVTRVDILEDTGISLSPEVDVGQVRLFTEIKLIFFYRLRKQRSTRFIAWYHESS